MSTDTVPPTPPKKSWKWPTYRAGAVERWIGEALTQFINGFIKGWKHGVGTGAGTGALTGLNPDIAANVTAWQQILLSVGALVFAMTMNGINQVTAWHETNPFPNPWGKYDPNAPDTKAPFVALLFLCFLPFLGGCVHTTIKLPNGDGEYSSTSLFASRQAKSITVNLGPDKSVKIDGYGQDATEVAKQALSTATAALNHAP